MWRACDRATSLMREFSPDAPELVITSGRRTQSPGGSSLHPHGKAMDIRTWEAYFKDNEAIREFARILRFDLGPNYDVIVEGPASEDSRYWERVPHIHVEFDPKSALADG